MLPDPRPRSLAFRRPLFCVVHTLLPSLLLGLGLGGVGCGCSSLLLPDSLLLPLCSPEQLQRSELLRSLQPRLEFTLGRGGGFSFPGVYLSVGEQPTYKPSANPGILLEGRRIYPRLAPP